MTANRAASIRARLKQHTDTSKPDFNLTLTRYGLERLLYRLSISEHAPNFLLKGALLFQLWYPTLLPDVHRTDLARLPQGHGRGREAARRDRTGHDQHPYEGLLRPRPAVA
jgi:hypothetical protein